MQNNKSTSDNTHFTHFISTPWHYIWIYFVIYIATMCLNLFNEERYHNKQFLHYELYLNSLTKKIVEINHFYTLSLYLNLLNKKHYCNEIYGVTLYLNVNVKINQLRRERKHLIKWRGTFHFINIFEFTHREILSQWTISAL